MRKLKTSDIPACCRLIKKLGIKESIREAASQADNIDDLFNSVWDKGFDIIWSIFDRATELESEAVIYEFFAGPFECTPEEFADMDIAILFEGIERLVKENDLKRFFELAQKSMR